MDSWLLRRERKELIKWLGFLLLAAGFFVNATVIDQTALGLSILGSDAQAVSQIIRLVAYLLLIAGQLIDPIQEKPHTTGLPEPKKALKIEGVLWLPVAVTAVTSFGLPLASLIVGLLYLRRATTGLERHLKPVAVGFFFLAGFEGLLLAQRLATQDNIILIKLLEPFGWVWQLTQLLLLVAMILIGLWVWQYLIRRLQTQLTMIFTVTIATIFLVVTVSFTALLISNVNNESLTNLTTAAKVLDFALTSKRVETLVHAQSLAQNPDLIAAVAAGDHQRILSLTQAYLTDKKQSSLIVTSADAKVLSRVENPDRWGDSVSEDPLMKRVLIGQTATSVAAEAGALAPLVQIRSAAPIRQNGLIIGAVNVGLVIDNSFVDSIKQSTGLDTTIYGGDVRSATTFLAADNKSRLVGIKEDSPIVRQAVLDRGQDFRGQLTILNTPYLAVFSPIKDVDNVPVGMLFIGRTELSILQTVGQSIEISFLVVVGLLVLSLWPAYRISRLITNQLT